MPPAPVRPLTASAPPAGIPPRGPLHAALEAALVLGAGTSPFIASALLSGGAGDADAPLATELSDSLIAGTLIVELALAAVLLVILRWRGWRFSLVAGEVGPGEVARGAGLWLLSVLAYGASAFAWQALAPDVVAQLRHVVPTGSVSIWAATAMSIINPMFEEFLFLAFGINALRRFGLPIAGTVSIALRTAAHLYQGPMAIVGILPIGLVYTVYYARTGRLWPVVVAHVIQDAVALSLITR